MNLSLPELSLIVLIGPSGAGKSTFARTHFKPTEILSSDFCRALVSDDENNQAATDDAFDLLHTIARTRLRRGLLTVVDATNVRPEDRHPLVGLAREHHCLPVAIVFNLPERLCQDRNRARPDRDFGPHVIRQQRSALRRDLRNLRREGFRHTFTFATEEEVAAATVERVPLWNNRNHEHGPFDVIGDVHGCFDELAELIEKLGYHIQRDPARPEGDWSITPPTTPAATAGLSEAPEGSGRVATGGATASSPERNPWEASHDGGRPGGAEAVTDAQTHEASQASSNTSTSTPPARKLIFLGDLVDRGPKTPAVLRLVMRAVAEGKALCVPGNHDIKLVRALDGKNVKIAHGLAQSLEQLDAEPPEFRRQVRDFLDSLVSHYVLDDGRLVVAHAGLREEMQGRGSGRVREFCLYGETTGETDEFGLPIRFNWAAEYRGRAAVVYGHTPVPEADWLNGTINIDTGCVFGGRLTALRYPERQIVSVAARSTYAESARPFLPEPAAEASMTHVGLSAQQQADDMLHLEDVTGKRIIQTRLQQTVTIREENATAALEVMSRFAADPRWLIYLPPTMSPTETSREPGLLEHPAEAFEYFARRGVEEVVCEEKHMGSRAVVVLCRDEEVARRRFGVTTGAGGICYTRTGRLFFDDAELEGALLERLRRAAAGAGLWEELETDWMCLDCELMPWSAKAQGLLREQYAAVGSAGRAALAEAAATVGAAAARAPGAELAALLERTTARAEALEKYTRAYRAYCWPVESLDDLRLAPFHLLASEGAVHVDRDHLWHMATLARLAEQDGLFIATAHRAVKLADEADVAAAVAWWEDLTSRSGEGMVVKPRAFVAGGERGLMQPAIKCRGPEYLRIIYGPEYLSPSHLERLRSRQLKHKRSLALREFALGIEALERFVRREPLRRVHECVFGVLAMESEPVDPRL